MILQTGGAVPRSAVELVLTASPETKVVLVITAIFSLVSWFIIVFKWWQFRRLNRQADKFFAEMERTTRLQEAYHAVMKQPPSPYNRLFREAITFYSELRPGALREERGADRSAITPDSARGAQDGARQGGRGRARPAGSLHPLARDDRLGEPAARPARHHPGHHQRLHGHRHQGVGQSRRGGAGRGRGPGRDLRRAWRRRFRR